MPVKKKKLKSKTRKIVERVRREKPAPRHKVAVIIGAPQSDNVHDALLQIAAISEETVRDFINEAATVELRKSRLRDLLNTPGLIEQIRSRG